MDPRGKIPSNMKSLSTKCCKYHDNERFELQYVAIPLKWQLPAPQCCKLQGQRTDQQIPKNPKTKKKHPEAIPDSLYIVFFKTEAEPPQINVRAHRVSPAGPPISHCPGGPPWILVTLPVPRVKELVKAVRDARGKFSLCSTIEETDFRPVSSHFKQT